MRRQALGRRIEWREPHGIGYRVTRTSNWKLHLTEMAARGISSFHVEAIQLLMKSPTCCVRACYFRCCEAAEICPCLSSDICSA